MAWGDLQDSSQSTTSTLAAGMQTYYDQTFLEQAADNLHMMQFAEKRPLPKNKGKTISFFRYNALSAVTSALTEGSNPSATAVDDHVVTRTIEEWGEWHQYSSLVSLTHIDAGLTDMAKLFGANAGRSVDLRIMKEVVTCGAHSMSADADAAACGAGMRPGQWLGAEDGTTASTTGTIYCETVQSDTTLIADAGGNDTDNWWIGGQITFTEGQNYGQSRYVYDHDAGTYALLVYPAFGYAPADGDNFILSHPGKSGAQGATAHALAATDTLTHTIFARAREDLQTWSAPEYSGGYYIFLLGPTTNAGFMTDTDGGWMGLAQYRGQAMFKGEIGKYMGFRVVQTNQPFRATLPTTATTGGPGATSSTDYTTCGANYSKSGTGHYNLAFGRGAFGVTLFPGWKTPKFLYKALGSAGAADPLDMQGSVGWKIPFVPCALNALWCVSVVSGG